MLFYYQLSDLLPSTRICSLLGKSDFYTDLHNLNSLAHMSTEFLAFLLVLKILKQGYRKLGYGPAKFDRFNQGRSYQEGFLLCPGLRTFSILLGMSS